MRDLELLIIFSFPERTSIFFLGSEEIFKEFPKVSESNFFISSQLLLYR